MYFFFIPQKFFDNCKLNIKRIEEITTILASFFISITDDVTHQRRANVQDLTFITVR